MYCILQVIKSFLTQKFYKTEVKFILSVSKTLSRFTENFQSSTNILIHTLYDEICTLYIKIINQVKKSTRSSLFKFSDVKAQLLPIADIVLPADVKAEFNAEVDCNERDQLSFLLNVQKHYLAIAGHLYDKCLEGNTSLKFFRFIKPDNVKSKSFTQDVAEISKLLSLGEDVIDETLLQDECSMLVLEADGILKNSNAVLEFWKEVFDLKYHTGALKHPNLSCLVKACFTLSHGNADVERGFSVCGYILDDKKTAMTEELLNALLNIRSGMQRYDNKPHKFVVTRELIKMARLANCSYKLHCEENKKKEEQKEEKAKAERKRLEEVEKKEQERSAKKKKLEVYENSLKELTTELGTEKKSQRRAFPAWQ